MRILLSLAVLLAVCISHSCGHRGKGKHERGLTGKHPPHERGLVGKHPAHKRGLTGKHPSQEIRQPGEAALEDRRPGLEKDALKRKVKECNCDLFTVRRRRHSKRPRKHMMRKCMKKCMRERQGCQGEHCNMELAMPMS